MMYKCSSCSWHVVKTNKHYSYCPDCHAEVIIDESVTNPDIYFDEDEKETAIYTKSDLFRLMYEIFMLDIKSFHVVQIVFLNQTYSLSQVAEVFGTSKQAMDYKIKQIKKDHPVFNSLLDFSKHNKSGRINQVSDNKIYTKTFKKIRRIINEQSDREKDSRNNQKKASDRKETQTAKFS